MLIPRTVLALGRVCFQEVTRYAMNGVQFERLQDKSCRAVATNGWAVVVATWKDGTLWDWLDSLPWPIDKSVEPEDRPKRSGVFPVHAIDSVIRSLGRRWNKPCSSKTSFLVLAENRTSLRPTGLMSEPPMSVTYAVQPSSGSSLHFGSVTARPVEGVFPPWEDAWKRHTKMPVVFTTHIRVQHLYDVVQAMFLAAGARTKHLQVQLDFTGTEKEPQGILVSLSDPEFGDVAVDVEVKGLLMPCTGPNQ